jgi:hypothetical protein
MLSLSNDQLRTVMQAAGMLPPDDRDNFLKSLASRLSPHPTNGEIAAALAFVLGAREVSVHPTLFLHESEPRRRGAYARRARRA